jgi:hypothetical protein
MLDPAEMTVMPEDVILGVAAQDICEFEAGARCPGIGITHDPRPDLTRAA